MDEKPNKKSRKREKDDQSSQGRSDGKSDCKRKCRAGDKSPSNRSRSNSQQRSSKQTETPNKNSVSESQMSNFNDNRSSNSSVGLKTASTSCPGKYATVKNFNQKSILTKARRNLIDEMDAIDDQFQQESDREITAPDGIRITVNCEEENEFDDEQLDYDEDEEIYPVDSDAETVEGEGNNLNDSLASSQIISFKEQSRSCSKPIDGGVTHKINISTIAGKERKRVEDMTPDELAEANPALKKWMNDMMAKKSVRSSNKKNGNVTNDNRLAQKESGRMNKAIERQGAPLVSNVIKSPSDTTIYAPALKLTPNVRTVVPTLVQNERDKVDGEGELNQMQVTTQD